MNADALLVHLTARELRDVVRDAVRAELGDREDAPEVLTREQAASLLNLNAQVVARYVKTRKLPAMKVGRQWRFRRSELLAWLAENRP